MQTKQLAMLLLGAGLLALPSCESTSQASESSSVGTRIFKTIRTGGEREHLPDDGVARSGSLSLVSYNIAGLPWVVSSSDPITNTPLMGQHLNQFDIALLQEDFYYHEDLIPGVQHEYRTEPHDTDPSIFDMHDGLNRFSKFKIHGHSRHTWTNCAGYITDSCDCLAKKGFTSAMMRIGESTDVRVYNVHFDAGESDTDAEARRLQFRQLADHIHEHAADEAIIIGGDVNLVDFIDADKASFEAFLDETGLVDTCRETQCTDEMFDKVLYRSSRNLTFELRSRELLTFLDSDQEELSDHKPVGVVLGWAKRGI